jgi:hypothetical protein
MALGSTPGAIAALVLRQGGVWLGVGLVLGDAGVLAVVRALRGLLFGLRSTRSHSAPASRCCWCARPLRC